MAGRIMANGFSYTSITGHYINCKTTKIPITVQEFIKNPIDTTKSQAFQITNDHKPKSNGNIQIGLIEVNEAVVPHYKTIPQAISLQ